MATMWLIPNHVFTACLLFLVRLTNHVALAQLALQDEECILGADLFTDKLEILSASVGFDNIIGVGGGDDEATSEAVGAAYNFNLVNLDTCPVTGGDPADGPLTSAVAPIFILALWDCAEQPDQIDGYPICFSWPVLPCSIHREHVQYTRSDGAVFSPNCIGAAPNNEFNERHCIVLFDQFINRVLPGENTAQEERLAMVRVDIVGDLLFVGPGGVIVSGKGLSRVAPPEETPYLSGPVFIGARLSPLTDLGEGYSQSLSAVTTTFFPNSGVSLFVQGTADRILNDMFRLRLYYSGGMKPDGLESLQPVLFGDYFVLQFENGVEIDMDNTPTVVQEGTEVTVLGLADTGLKQDVGYDLCYAEDSDNYIDIIVQVKGNKAVLEGLTQVLAFSKGKALYNPGGPGPTPFENVTYTAPGPANQVVTVLVDLQNEHQTTFCVHEDGTNSTEAMQCTMWRSAGVLWSTSIPNGNQRQCPPNLEVVALTDYDPPTGTPTLSPTATPSGSDAPARFVNWGLLLFALAMAVLHHSS